MEHSTKHQPGEFRKYQHVERLGTQDTEGILVGPVHIFPKLDGANGVVWFDEESGKVACGSRNREISIEDDNRGFAKYVSEHHGIQDYLKLNRDHVLYGEWLVPHTLKTYKDGAWNQFYVFDVVDGDGNYIEYSNYSVAMKLFGIQYIPVLVCGMNLNKEFISGVAKSNTYLVSEGIGEGVVIKNYGYRNKFGRQTWAKLVINGQPPKRSNKQKTHSDEEAIIDRFMTRHMADKVMARIVNEHGGWESKKIPMLLNMSYHDLIVEEMWNILQKYRSPRINFRTLKLECDRRVKELLPEAFGIVND